MGSGASKRDNGTRLLLLGIVWLCGTPLLAALAFSYGFALAGAEPRNAPLAAAFAVAALAVGVGAPVVGLLISLATGKKVAAALFAAPLVVLLFCVVRTVPIDRVPVSNEPEVCTAPPDKAVGVPGC
jgi:hypothetical protein